MSARLATERETDLAIMVGAVDEDARRECHDRTRWEDRTNSGISHLDYSLRDVDDDDLHVYLPHSSLVEVVEWRAARASAEYERGEGEQWPN